MKRHIPLGWSAFRAAAKGQTALSMPPVAFQSLVARTQATSKTASISSPLSIQRQHARFLSTSSKFLLSSRKFEAEEAHNARPAPSGDAPPQASSSRHGLDDATAPPSSAPQPSQSLPNNQLAPTQGPSSWKAVTTPQLRKPTKEE